LLGLLRKGHTWNFTFLCPLIAEIQNKCRKSYCNKTGNTTVTVYRLNGIESDVKYPSNSGRKAVSESEARWISAAVLKG
jgi:hypothetical protein